MIAQFTRNERRSAILISLAVEICGLSLGLAGRDDPIGIRGALIFLAGFLMIFRIGKDCFAPSPPMRGSPSIMATPARPVSFCR